MVVNGEGEASVPLPVNQDGFNTEAALPYDLSIDHMHRAMSDFVEFLRLVNGELYTNDMPRLESILMSANFSSMVGEFMIAAISRHCAGLEKNMYHNGHPDLLPTNLFENNAAQHASVGIEVKASRYNRGWQGHNPEDTWLMVFVFDSNRPNDPYRDKPVAPKPFRFVRVVGARLQQADWTFSGRSAGSRRTITASVNPTGYAKMSENWIYGD